MSKSEQIREIAYQLLHSTGQCSYSDLHKKMVENHIYISPESALLRAAMSQLVKSDPTIVRSKRGNYIYTQYTEDCKMDTSLSSQSTNELLTTLETAEQTIRTIIKRIQTFDWVNCSDDELHCMRSCAQQLQKFQKEITISK